MGDISEFKRRHIFGTLLAGAFVTRKASLCGVSRATVSRVMLAYHHEGRTTSNRSNCRHKRKLSERDVRVLSRIVSKIHKKNTAVQLMAELNVYLNSLVSTKTVRRELHRVTIHGRAAIDKTFGHSFQCQMSVSLLPAAEILCCGQCETCIVACPDATIHCFKRVAFYCGQPKAHLCNNHAV